VHFSRPQAGSQRISVACHPKCCAGAFAGCRVGHALGNAEKVLRRGCAKRKHQSGDTRRCQQVDPMHA